MHSNNNHEVKFELIEKTDIAIIIPLLQELDPSIPANILTARLQEMVEHGYECVGLFDGSELIGICGIWILVKYYIGKHIEADNVYIKDKYRGLGLGKKLNSWLKKFALSRACEAIELNCYITNEKGNQFWEANEFIALGIHYQKKLKSPQSSAFAVVTEKLDR